LILFESSRLALLGRQEEKSEALVLEEADEEEYLRSPECMEED
jgi:hypothetical protein